MYGQYNLVLSQGWHKGCAWLHAVFIRPYGFSMCIVTITTEKAACCREGAGMLGGIAAQYMAGPDAHCRFELDAVQKAS